MYQGVKDINKDLKNDLKYIEKDLITEFKDKYGNKRYIKFSRFLNEVATTDLTPEKYKQYWQGKYGNYPEQKEKITIAAETKFKYDLTDIETMINLIENSKDIEKDKYLEILRR